MVEFPIKLVLVARTRLKTRARLEAENIVLRQQVIRLAVPNVPHDSECNHCGQARDCYSVASARVSRLLALEIQPSWWPSQDRPRDPRPDPTDE